MNAQHKWTSADEQALQTLTKRKEEILSAHSELLTAALTNAGLKQGSMSSFQQVLIALRDHADSIRDALQPFDSGMRAKP